MHKYVQLLHFIQPQTWQTDRQTDRHIDAEVLHPLQQRQMETASFKAMEQPKTPLSYFDADGGFVLSPYGKITWNSSVSDDVVVVAVVKQWRLAHTSFIPSLRGFWLLFRFLWKSTSYDYVPPHHWTRSDFLLLHGALFFGAASTLKPTNAANACNVMPGSSVNLVRFKCWCLH